MSLKAFTFASFTNAKKGANERHGIAMLATPKTALENIFSGWINVNGIHFVGCVCVCVCYSISRIYNTYEYIIKTITPKHLQNPCSRFFAAAAASHQG